MLNLWRTPDDEVTIQLEDKEWSLWFEWVTKEFEYEGMKYTIEVNTETNKLVVSARGVLEWIASFYRREDMITKKNPDALTAYGPPLNDTQLRAAHKFLEPWTKVKVSRDGSEKSVIVTIADRWPYTVQKKQYDYKDWKPIGKHVWKHRLIDLTIAAGVELWICDENGEWKGICDVKVDIL